LQPLREEPTPLAEEQEENTDATTTASTTIKIDFLILRYLVLKDECLANEEMGPGNSEEGTRNKIEKGLFGG
jgi:hypothetical protein